MTVQERQSQIQGQLISFQNNHDLPLEIRAHAQELEMHLVFRKVEGEALEMAYREVQLKVCDHIEKDLAS